MTSRYEAKKQLAYMFIDLMPVRLTIISRYYHHHYKKEFCHSYEC